MEVGLSPKQKIIWKGHTQYLRSQPQKVLLYIRLWDDELSSVFRGRLSAV